MKWGLSESLGLLLQIIAENPFRFIADNIPAFLD
jgi:hypothetical protein